eukprot:660623-Pleurochrysis_carterae.AAC.1
MPYSILNITAYAYSSKLYVLVDGTQQYVLVSKAIANRIGRSACKEYMLGELFCVLCRQGGSRTNTS